MPKRTADSLASIPPDGFKADFLPPEAGFALGSNPRPAPSVARYLLLNWLEYPLR